MNGVDPRSLQRGMAAAEELHAAGHSRHAVAALLALLRPALLPPHCRRDEIRCRVRAAEILFTMATSASHGNSNSHRDGSSRCSHASNRNSVPANVARLDLVQSVLSPMFSTRRYFESVVIRPLLWKESPSQHVEDVDEDSRLLPLALLLRAYVLSAELQRRRLRYAQAVKYIEAAQQWCAVVFAPPIHTAVEKSTGIQIQQQQEQEQQWEEERRCCEAFLSVELCRVYYAQFMSAGTPINAHYIPNTAAVHNTRMQAIQSLLRYAGKYAHYMKPTSSVFKKEEEERKEVSLWCLSSPLNSFSIQAAARVLCHFYYTALFLDHRLEAAVHHMRQCEVLFGVSPELQCVQDLLTGVHRGLISSNEKNSGVKRQRSDDNSDNSVEPNNVNNTNDEDETLKRENTTPSCSMMRMMNLRWVSDGLLLSLRSYIDFHTAATAEMPSFSSPPQISGNVWKQNKETEIKKEGKGINDDDENAKGSSSSEKVDYLFQSTLQHIDKQLTLLTTTTTNVQNINSSDTEFHLLRSFPSTDIRFLVLLKCASLITMISYDLSQLRLREGLQRLVQLRRYMKVFRKHTEDYRVHYHLLASQLALTLSLRHIDGVESTLSSHPTSNDGISQQRRLTEKDEEELTAGFDVGLPYAHIRAAEEAALTATQPCSPSLLLFISLMKGAALYHTTHVGATLQLNTDGGFTMRDLALHQRHRCGTALANVLEALKTSLASVSTTTTIVKEEKEEEEKEEKEIKEEGERDVKEDHLRQLHCAWTISNQLLLLLLRGVTAMTEEKDEPTAICTFKEALEKAIQYFGMQSSITAECLYLLALAYREYEQVELQPPKESMSSSTVMNLSTLPSGLSCKKENCVDEVLASTEHAQQTFLFAWLLASQKSRLAKLHCVLNIQGDNNNNKDYRGILEECNMEVRHICSSMQEELLEVLSL
ncbi:uncharacterized protein TM35_000031380 [Trypanosoma theileri]|uniref:Uncharacterized protein n=1 Tax=Trypanosoma theileri TaxID=67003 RepID=A0A1X0P682_9TRYP|nr:uncharacterized protein TM35_000031380 [Trypanosoma theileri]ORC92385.1 hypothetical protein TM35_000031380 [Trypanosoma theileri]